MGEIVWKLRNAAGGFWDSLDVQERRLLVLGCAYVVGAVVASLMGGDRERRERDRLVREVADELERRSRGR